MKPALQCLTLFAASLGAAVGASAQEPVPVSNWQSATSETITWPLHPALTGGELFLRLEQHHQVGPAGKWPPRSRFLRQRLERVDEVRGRASWRSNS